MGLNRTAYDLKELNMDLANGEMLQFQNDASTPPKHVGILFSTYTDGVAVTDIDGNTPGNGTIVIDFAGNKVGFIISGLPQTVGTQGVGVAVTDPAAITSGAGTGADGTSPSGAEHLLLVDDVTEVRTQLIALLTSLETAGLIAT